MSGEAEGQPAAEPALTVDTREELVYLLGQACEIEHGLMCEYLYAQFSLKRGLDEGLTEGQLARGVAHRIHQDLRRRPWPSGQGGIRCRAQRGGGLSAAPGILLG